MALTLTEANRMVQAAIAKAEELNVKLSVAVCDAGGNLVAFNRMQGASAVSATVAQGKAAASARPNNSTPWPLHHPTDGCQLTLTSPLSKNCDRTSRRPSP